MDWQHYSFAELTGEKLHAVLEARQSVFILEQQCLYADIDGLDLTAQHLLGCEQNSDTLLAYARLLPPAARFPGPALGRILVTREHRDKGIGRELVRQGLDLAATLYPGQAVHISAQVQLEQFYCELGFETVSRPYDDDGIMHIDMLAAS